MRVKCGCFENLPADYTHVRAVPCPPSEQFMLLLQGHCKPVISRRRKVMTGKREAYRTIITHSAGFVVVTTIREMSD